jgi:hypothetical protein
MRVNGEWPVLAHQGPEVSHEDVAEACICSIGEFSLTCREGAH